MSDLFALAKPAPAQDPRTKRCAACGSERAHCGVAGQWFCIACVPPSFFPKNRSAA